MARPRRNIRAISARRTPITWARSKAPGASTSTFIDTYTRVALVKLYDRKNALSGRRGSQ